MLYFFSKNNVPKIEIYNIKLVKLVKERGFKHQ